MPLATATIGTANAGAGPVLEPMALPLDPGGSAERRSLENLARRARSQGIVGARIFGHVVPAPPHAADAVHALLGTWAFVAAAIGLDVGLWALCAVTVSAALRAMGVSGLEHLLPKRPTWSLLLRPCGVATRRFYVAPTDRARVVPRLPFVALGALAIALLALAGGLLPRALGAAAVVGVGLYSMWLNRPTRVEPDGPEVEAARALLRLAEQEHDPTVAVALVGGASARGDGIVALLDWWALRPEEVEVCLVVPKGSPAADAAATLTRAGWRVRTLSPDALRSPP